METNTIYVDQFSSSLRERINRAEEKGWAVRLIEGVFYLDMGEQSFEGFVVFERERR